MLKNLERVLKEKGLSLEMVISCCAKNDKNKIKLEELRNFLINHLKIGE